MFLQRLARHGRDRPAILFFEIFFFFPAPMQAATTPFHCQLTHHQDFSRPLYSRHPFLAPLSTQTLNYIFLQRREDIQNGH
jgi:hypothetical protein